MRFKYRVHLRLSCLFVALLLSACSTTEMVGTWRDQQFQGAIDSMLVIAKVQDESLRRMFEDRFAEALQDRRVNAVASYRVFPELAELEKDPVEKKEQALELEGNLIVRLLEKEKVEYRHRDFGPYPYYDPFSPWPPYYRSWHSYYMHGYGYPYAPYWTTQATAFVLETNLFRTSDGNLIWSIRTRTTTYYSPEQKIDEVVKKVVGQLEVDGMI